MRPATNSSALITYIPTWEGWLYLATVIDCYSKKVIAHAMDDHYRTSLITAAIRGAAATGLADQAIFHTDRGSNYTSAEFHTALVDLGLRHSTGRTGICYDNAMAESFFAALKNERVHPTAPSTRPVRTRSATSPGTSTPGTTPKDCTPASATRLPAKATPATEQRPETARDRVRETRGRSDINGRPEWTAHCPQLSQELPFIEPRKPVRSRRPSPRSSPDTPGRFNQPWGNRAMLFRDPGRQHCELLHRHPAGQPHPPVDPSSRPDQGLGAQ